MKISVLDMQRKEAKQKYSDALSAYVTLYFGRPLEKLNVGVLFLFRTPHKISIFVICRRFSMVFKQEWQVV